MAPGRERIEWKADSSLLYDGVSSPVRSRFRQLIPVNQPENYGPLRGFTLVDYLQSCLFPLDNERP